MDVNVQWALTFALFSLPVILTFIKWIPPLIIYLYVFVLLIVAVFIPLIFYSSLYVQRGVLYFYFFNKGNIDDLKNPEKFGFPEATNFYLQNKDISLGVWHLPPTGSEENIANYEKSLADGSPVVLYIHGNVGTRATDHRLQLYQILNELQCHVIAFDYRCYGDSTYSTPNEEAIVGDCLVVADWVIQKIGSSPLFLYGHSLGSGFTTNIASQLARKGLYVNGVILEAAFTNMSSEIKVHPLGTCFRLFPWYNFLHSSPYETNGEDFRSSMYIQHIPSPILLLHAEDDGIIPSCLSEELYTIGQETRPKEYGPMTLHLFEASKKLGHSNICEAPEIPYILRTFIETFKNKTY